MTGITLSPLELLEKLAALVPLPRVHLVWYGSCLAPHSRLHTATTLPPHQQSVEEPEASRTVPRWSWPGLLKRVFDLDTATCPFCQRGALRICRHHPRGGNHADTAASEACGLPVPHRSNPFSPRNFGLGGLSSRPRSWPRRRRTCNGGGAHLFWAFAIPFESITPSFPQPPFPRPAPQGTPGARPSPLLQCVSGPHGATLCLAAGHSEGCRAARGAAGVVA
jgi:hypothetical protein